MHSHQQCKRDPFAQHPPYQLLFIYFLMMAILTGMWWHLFAVWFAFLYNEWCWASFQVFFSHLYYLLWRNAYVFCPLLLGCLFFWYWATWATCKFWRLILCQLFCLLLFSLILMGCLLALFIVSFIVPKLLSLIRSYLFIFTFISITLRDGS